MANPSSTTATVNAFLALLEPSIREIITAIAEKYHFERDKDMHAKGIIAAVSFLANVNRNRLLSRHEIASVASSLNFTTGETKKQRKNLNVTLELPAYITAVTYAGEHGLTIGTAISRLINRGSVRR